MKPDSTDKLFQEGPGISLALYQPDIAGNTGTIMRLGACLGLPVEIIEPAGFDLSDRALKRAGMDYLAMSRLVRHVDFAAFDAARRAAGRRIVLFTTRSSEIYTDFTYEPGDVLMFGRESAGVTDAIHATADASVTIPMEGGGRSINLAVAAGMAAGEVLRQLRWQQ
ncbi:RNA methyltransferase [Aurantimonas manganoxydans SI85-9A1]|uniref:tRNA (cytidine(34)-2'-O)-methyltransferase n=1 Tax=Aurantimonas manganoxydans (strain ATCC BAA-1229 / DSM 21871 / SI85-9A1) TaxID=287752 RepID=Q1YLW1_AURMS|nr:tRNA (cytidine(34)-2'-O)-methyltransferase [Aurantimonas manganoxydans]EAS51620.1 RNA methyltransferase [Aurantimonas manganoxydans SI85-9A1]